MIHRIGPTLLSGMLLMVAVAGCAKERYAGDLPELRSRGVLRVIVRPEPIAFLPRNAEPVTLDREIAQGLAEALGLELRLVVVDHYAQMVEKLLDGEGDVIAAGLAATMARRKRVAFSVPYQYVNELLIMPNSENLPRKPADLANLEIGVRRSSSFFETLVELKQRVPSLQIREVSETLNTEEIVDRVAQGMYPATVVDSNYWTAITGHYDSLRAPLVLSRNSPVALAMRPVSNGLKQRIDEYLHARPLTRHRQALFTDDLDSVKQRRRLRMITRNNAETYFIHRGVQVGFEYELMKRFAEQQGLRLEIVIPPSHGDLIPWLNAGKGDVIAAAMTVNDVRVRQAAFTRPYMEVDEVVVVRTDDDLISGPEDLGGKTVHVRASSSFYQSLLTLQQTVTGIRIDVVPEDMETEEILAAVDEGRWDITLCDASLLQVEQAYGRRLKAAFSIKETPLGWAVRKDNPLLLAALDEYIKKEYRQLFFNMMQKRYFVNRRTIARARSPERADVSGRLSPYDDLVKKYADQYGFDWRLITAQMYQESRFDPDVVSWAGAGGLMQVMPGTARHLGVGDVRQPEAGIHAGVKYLHQMLQRFNPQMQPEARIRFALAAYNVGYEHVADARRLAIRKGWETDRWFDHVEKAMLLLQKPEYYRLARYGYCRGGQPVHYVRAIQDRYEAYVDVLESGSKKNRS